MRTSGIVLLVAYLGFISLGLPDAAHGINWPFVRADYHVPTGWLGLVIASGGVGYLVSSFSVANLLARCGVGWLLILSSLLVSIGLFGFCLSPNFICFMLFAVVIGLGSGAIDAGLNAYAAENFSTQHMNWLHAAFGIGATSGPIIVTSVLVHFSQNWRLAYGVIGTILLFMTMVFVLSRHLWRNPSQSIALNPDSCKSDVTEPAPANVSQWQALRHPLVRLQIAFFLVYTGLEVGVGQWAFTVMTDSRGISISTAGTWVAIFWGALAFGRAIFGFLVEHFAVDPLLALCLMGMVLGAFSFSLPYHAYYSYLGLMLMGFCAAPIFPCMISQTALRVGKPLAAHAIGFQMSAAVSGAMTLPFISGLLGELFGLTVLSISLLIYALVLLTLFVIIINKADRGLRHSVDAH
ncbi:MFS transporter [Marinomonas sp. THO17]|uniref:MFS transporter n=1 Tax=Marinomonas sp. THO17 TaxID=3149048 RepID=UPI00336BF354